MTDKPEDKSRERKYRWLIITVSIVLPVVIAILDRVELGFGEWTKTLPLVNAIVNGTTFFVLLAAFFAIKSKNIALHRNLMFTAFGLSLIFLVCYVINHASNGSTPHGGSDAARYTYYGLLISHILAAIAIVPLALITVVRALAENFDRHRRIAKITLPLWLYVAATGVLVYLMISPYYT